MDVKRAVSQFVSQGGDLFHLLRSDGIQLSESELVMLSVQLHILENEVGIIRGLQKYQAKTSARFSDGKDRTTAKKQAKG
jgi:hypothetical protein